MKAEEKMPPRKETRNQNKIGVNTLLKCKGQRKKQQKKKDKKAYPINT